MAPYRSYRISGVERVDRGLDYLSKAIRKSLLKLIKSSEEGLHVVSGRDRHRRSLDIESSDFDEKIFYYNMSDMPRKPIYELGNHLSFVVHRKKKVLVRAHGNWNAMDAHRELPNIIVFHVWSEDYDGQAIGFLKDLAFELCGVLEELDPTIGSPVRTIK